MARLSRTRTGNKDYNKGYLRSPGWFARRREWFEDFVEIAGTVPFCYVCHMTRTQLGGLDLHHLSYEGVGRDHRNRWVANEDHLDLIPLCRQCHTDVHSRLDDGKTYYGWSRENASFVIIRDLRTQLADDPVKLQRLRSRAK